MSALSSLTAVMRYRDVAAASDWLCAAFGFQKHFVANGQAGVVHYAQLIFGDAMLMLAPVRDSTLDKYMKQPDEIGGAETQTCYLLVSDADAHYARAKASGAEIILDIQDDDFGGRSYACRDTEGHIWTFGTYDPWQGKHVADRLAQSAGSGARGAGRKVVTVALLLITIASALSAAAMYGTLRQSETVGLATRQVTLTKEVGERTARAAQERLSAEQSARAAAEQAVREVREELAGERSARETAAHALDHVSKRMAEETRAREAAENSVREARQELDHMRHAKETDGSERAAGVMRELLDRERAAKQIAERNAEQVRQRVIEQQNAREAAERTVQEMREQLDRERALKETAKRTTEQATLRASEEQSARDTAERVAKEARELLKREESSKNAAWKTAAQLRKQLSQMQSAKEPAVEPSAEPPSSAPALKASSALPKQKQKAKVQSPQE